MLLCSSLTYNAKEIRMLLKEEADETSKWTVEWIIIDPASFTGNRPPSLWFFFLTEAFSFIYFNSKNCHFCRHRNPQGINYNYRRETPPQIVKISQFPVILRTRPLRSIRVSWVNLGSKSWLQLNYLCLFLVLAAFPQRTASGRSSTGRPRETPTSTFPWRATSTRTSPSTWPSNANLSSTSSTSSSPVCSSPSWPRSFTTCPLTVSAQLPP